MTRFGPEIRANVADGRQPSVDCFQLEIAIVPHAGHIKFQLVCVALVRSERIGNSRLRIGVLSRPRHVHVEHGHIREDLRH